MLRKSFILFSGIGAKKERRLWSEGAMDWSDLFSKSAPSGTSAVRFELENAEANYAAQHDAYFYDLLPSGERWRMLSSFSKRFAFIDVELDRFSRYAEPTLLGICRGGLYIPLVRGFNLDSKSVEQALNGADVLVTYNGRRHDIHFLRQLLGREGRRLRMIDLRFVARKAGFSGGLKQLERTIGVERSRYVELAAHGQTARLWKMWKSNGSRSALELLMAYNKEDTCNLHPIALKLGAILEERALADVV